jgi:hypothetical protein
MYWGARALHLAGIPVDRAEATATTASFANADGGFGLEDDSSLWHTYCAARAMFVVSERQWRALD